MDSLSFSIPEQHVPSTESFDIHPQAIERWVAELPMGDTAKAAKCLLLMLQETNELKFSPTLRAELLERVVPALDSVLETLRCHYYGLAFPLPRKSVRIAQFANRLLSEAVIAHQTVHNASDKGSWLFRRTHRDLWVRSGHRILVYLSHILCNYRLIQRPYPDSVWRMLHQRYWQAQQGGRHHDKIAWPGRGQRSSIEQEYKRALLLSLIEPQMFRPDQLDEVYRTMPRWLEDARLTHPAKQCEELPAYCICADDDVPYTIFSGQCAEICEKTGQSVLLDLTRLDEGLERVLERNERQATIALRGADGEVSRETLETLKQCWRVPQKSREARHRCDRQVEVAIGMNAIYALMLQDMATEQAEGISTQQMSDKLHPLFGQGGAREKLALSPKEHELWEDVSFLVGGNNWALSAAEKGYRFISARELNYTETGHCLSLSGKDIDSLQVGELVGYHEAPGKSLQLFMVRWLKDNGETLTVGLMRLAANVEPALVLRHPQPEGEEQKLAFGCLLGIGEDRRPQLFLPSLKENREQPIYLAVDDKELPISLHEKVAFSPLFESYHFVAAESLQVPSTGEEIPLREVNERLHRIAHLDEEHSDRDRDAFADLWEAL